MRYLVLLNRRFPYKYGEAFLENEIDEISSFFDRIIIFPSDMRISDPITRIIKSENVDVITFEDAPLKLRKMSYMLGGIQLVHLQKGKSIKQSLFDAYFNAACKNQCKKILTILNQYDFGKDDEVIIYSYWLYISAKVAVDIKRYYKDKTNIRCVSRAHAFDIYDDKRYLPERNYILEGIDGVFPCSENGTQYLKNKYPKYNKKIKTAYLGTYDHGVSTKTKSSAFRIVSCSRIAPEKRIDLLIDALSLLKDCCIPISWTHFGSGDRIGEIKKRVESELSFMEVNLPGAVQNSEILMSYANDYYNVFINTSSAEGLPVSIMEASSFGIPVIATNVGGTSEIVIDKYNGFLLDKESTAKRIADTIKKLIEMEQQDYAILRVNSREHWERNFQAKTNYAYFSKQLIQLFSLMQE